MWRDDPRLVPTIAGVRTTRKVGIKSSKPLLWLRYSLSVDVRISLGSRSYLKNNNEDGVSRQDSSVGQDMVRGL